ncbi:MAG: NYN domain-containing protein [Algisphaera sp.]
MPLLVDCYNVLRSDLPLRLAGMNEGQLCAALGRSRWAQGGVTVVADGRSKPLGAIQSPVAGVALVYSGMERSADDVIVSRVRESAAARRITVVTDDREIRVAVRACGAKELGTELFAAQLCDDLDRGGPRRQAGRPEVGLLDSESVNAWLDVFGVDRASGQEKD